MWFARLLLVDGMQSLMLVSAMVMAGVSIDIQTVRSWMMACVKGLKLIYKCILTKCVFKFKTVST
jgi:hypothetical protein